MWTFSLRKGRIRQTKIDKECRWTVFQEDSSSETEEGQEKEATGYVSQTRDITGSFNRQFYEKQEDRLWISRWYSCHVVRKKYKGYSLLVIHSNSLWFTWSCQMFCRWVLFDRHRGQVKKLLVSSSPLPHLFSPGIYSQTPSWLTHPSHW